MLPEGPPAAKTNHQHPAKTLYDSEESIFEEMRKPGLFTCRYSCIFDISEGAVKGQASGTCLRTGGCFAFSFLHMISFHVTLEDPICLTINLR